MARQPRSTVASVATGGINTAADSDDFLIAVPYDLFMRLAAVAQDMAITTDELTLRCLEQVVDGHARRGTVRRRRATPSTP